jgi:hypothetical protein
MGQCWMTVWCWGGEKTEGYRGARSPVHKPWAHLGGKCSKLVEDNCKGPECLNGRRMSQHGQLWSGDQIRGTGATEEPCTFCLNLVFTFVRFIDAIILSSQTALHSLWKTKGAPPWFPDLQGNHVWPWPSGWSLHCSRPTTASVGHLPLIVRTPGTQQAQHGGGQSEAPAPTSSHRWGSIKHKCLKGWGQSCCASVQTWVHK